ncbi:MAG: hypothetical protein M3R48_10235 [Candidatus Dormibacteraeota bacterium]|nr:hypothetical protein [Candidatus Dormibacteraeota bacterium]
MYYYRPARTLFGLIAVGGAVAVGLTTHDAGFTALTFLGGLILPRVLGFRGHRPWGRAPGAAGATRGGGHSHFEQRFDSWHRQSHGESAGEQPPAAGTAGA